MPVDNNGADAAAAPAAPTGRAALVAAAAAARQHSTRADAATDATYQAASPKPRAMPATLLQTTLQLIAGMCDVWSACNGHPKLIF